MVSAIWQRSLRARGRAARAESSRPHGQVNFGPISASVPCTGVTRGRAGPVQQQQGETPMTIEARRVQRGVSGALLALALVLLAAVPVAQADTIYPDNVITGSHFTSGLAHPPGGSRLEAIEQQVHAAARADSDERARHVQRRHDPCRRHRDASGLAAAGLPAAGGRPLAAAVQRDDRRGVVAVHDRAQPGRRDRQDDVPVRSSRRRAGDPRRRQPRDVHVDAHRRVEQRARARSCSRRSSTTPTTSSRASSTTRCRTSSRVTRTASS